jgi:hypothetical protein
MSLFCSAFFQDNTILTASEGASASGKMGMTGLGFRVLNCSLLQVQEAAVREYERLQEHPT